MISLENIRIGVIGLGYVGLPLAIEFGKHFDTVGFDINPVRIKELREQKDRTLEVDKDEFFRSDRLIFSSDSKILSNCNVYIVTVPTPVTGSKTPDFSPLISASQLVGKHLEPGNVVIYESTVYPGATEEVCVPVLEAESYLRFNIDFSCGYSPERINPGDKCHRLVDIVKVTSGSNKDTSDFVDSLYRHIILAGTYRASSIRVAEAAKVIENTQRDLNIGFMNELAILFGSMDIDIFEVLKAASTKWNFLNFQPGLVGGHCISVDPYYLTYKAQEVGYFPELITAARRINDNMPKVYANTFIKLLIKRNLAASSKKVLLMGITFKENCPDIRNSKAVDLYRELIDFGLDVDVFDPIADPVEVKNEYDIDLLQTLSHDDYMGIVIAVGHTDFRVLDFNTLTSLDPDRFVVVDIKNIRN